MSKEDKIRAVASYLEGVMEGQERQEFELLLIKDAELQELIKVYQNIHQTLKVKIAPAAEDEAVESKLMELNKIYFKERQLPEEDLNVTGHPADDRQSPGVVAEEPQKAKQAAITPVVSEPVKTISLNAYLKWLSVAAILIIGLLIWAPWSASLYEKYTISKEISVAERGIGAESDLAKAAVCYNKGDFAGALKILEPAHQSDPENAQLAYYYGVTLLAQQKLTEARTLLLTLYQGESVFKYDAVYNLGLSYVREGNKEAAIKWLDKVPEGSANYDKAKELIGKLK